MQLSFDPSNPVERTTAQAIIDLLEEHNVGVVVADGPVSGYAAVAPPVKPRRKRAAPLIDTTTTVGPATPLPPNPALAELKHEGKEPEEIVIPKSTSVSTDIPGQQDLATILPDPVKVVVSDAYKGGTVLPGPQTVTSIVATRVDPPAAPTSKPKTIEDVRAAYRAMHDAIGSDKANRALLGALSVHGAANLSSLAAEKYQEVIDGFAKRTTTAAGAEAALS